MSRPEILSFGCRLNSMESDVMQRNAVQAGLSDVVIVNTCTVTAEAERQAGQAIRRLKREQPGKKIIVTGCASHIDPKKYEVMNEVDHVIANDMKLRPESFANISGHVPVQEGSFTPPTPAGAMQRTFVQVQNGCDHRCTFCIIPYGRGTSRSLPADEIIAQVQQRVAEGFNEVVLTGVDIASYGHDLTAQPTLGAVMRELLTAVPALPRLRLSSLDPAAMDEDLWDLIEHEPRLMPHLHLSLQAGDDMVLKRMKRRHLRDDVLHLVDRARDLRPDVVFGADIIAGFPTETDKMAQNTYELVERTELTWLHVFPYSSRAGTPAAKMPQVHGEKRKARADSLRALGDNAAARHYESLVGKTISVLVENNGIGCTPHFAKLKLTGDALVGKIVYARVLRTEENTAIAEIVNVA